MEQDHSLGEILQAELETAKSGIKASQDVLDNRSGRYLTLFGLTITDPQSPPVIDGNNYEGAQSPALLNEIYVLGRIRQVLEHIAEKSGVELDPKE